MSKMIETFKMLKEKHPDAIILFRCGDFYESYFDDAQKVADVTGTTLTKRSGKDEYYLTGFPHHALDTYLPKLIRAGYRVAICDYISEHIKLKKRDSDETTQEQQVEDAEAEEIKEEEPQPSETKSAKIIYTDKESEDYTPKNGKTFALTEMQEIVGGYIEIIRLNDGRIMIADEEGKLKNKEVNIPATNILRRDHYTTDYIVGTAIVCDADMVE